jgi:hypothetical protein
MRGTVKCTLNYKTLKDLQITFYKTVVSPASLYGCEMWAIK